MATASELFKQGQLQAALDAQLQDVKAHPADHGKRLFLFELALFSGDLERAKRQIDAVQYEEAERQLATSAYRKMLDAEEKRRRLFKDGLQPRFLADPSDHIKLRLEAINRLRENNLTEAAALLTKANEQTPELKGLLNGKAFGGLRDADDLFGTVLEAFVQGDYFWVALEQLEGLAANEPKFARDLYWKPVRLMLKGGQQGEAYLSALYPGSHESADETLKLGRATDWKQPPQGPVLGVGAKTFLVGEDGIPLHEWRELQLMV